MPRPRFDPDEPQQGLLRSIRKLAEQRKLVAEQLDQIDLQTDQLIARAEVARIPIEHIAAAAGRTRKTVYRHLGKTMK